MNIKSLITGKDSLAVLKECERGEDVALKNYQAALEKDLPQNVRVVIEKQLVGVQRNHDRVKQLRNSAQAAADLTAH